MAIQPRDGDPLDGGAASVPPRPDHEPVIIPLEDSGEVLALDPAEADEVEDAETVHELAEVVEVAEAAPSAGAGDDEQADIMRQIEDVVAANKIKVTPELFSIKARHSGNRLPILVNVSAALLLAVGIGGMYLLFNQAKNTTAGVQVQLKPAEGKLIEEIKKQNEAALAAKQKEIADIQSQLGDIAKQRDNLATDMNAKIEARAAELRRNMETELEAERQRLRAQGFSEEEIKRRLDAFERQKNEEFNAQIAAFRSQAEAQRKRSEAELKAKEDQFNQTLSQANQEKERIAAEARRKEEELRRQLEAQSAQAAAQAAAQVSAQRSQSEAQLNEAAAQIKRLAQAKDQEKQVATQIAGFYSSVRDQLRDKKTDQAVVTLNLLKDYLNSDLMNASEALKQRRDTDLFLVETLGGFIEREIRAAEMAASAGQSTADALRIQEATAQALRDAQAKYEAQIATLQQEAEALKAQVAELTAAQETAGAAGTLNEKQLRDQIATLEKSNKDALAAKDRIIAEREKSLAEMTALRDSLNRKSTELSAELAALRTNNAGLSKTIAELETTVASQKQEIAAQKDTLNLSSGNASDLGERIRSMDAQITELKATNQAISARLADSGKQLDQVRADLAKVQGERDAALADARAKAEQITRYGEDLAKVTVVANTYAAMVQSWTTYVEADKNLRAKLAGTAPAAGSSSRATAAAAVKSEETKNRETKVLLDTFLAGDLMRAAFPDLLDRIKSYDKAFENAGKENVTLEMADQVYTVLSFEQRKDRLAYVKEQIAKAGSNASLKEFYQNLYDLIATQDY